MYQARSPELETRELHAHGAGSELPKTTPLSADFAALVYLGYIACRCSRWRYRIMSSKPLVLILSLAESRVSSGDLESVKG
jgi:hypothetical protein